jgi:hypothetical protein
MIYVLILVISGHSVHTQEFNSQETCEAAVKDYLGSNNVIPLVGYRAICVKK